MQNNIMPQVEAEKKAVSEIVSAAKALMIIDQSSLDAAVGFVKDFIKPRKAKAEEIFNNPKTGITALAHAAWKATITLRDQILGPYEDARTVVDNKIITYRRAEREKAETEAQRRREEERRETQKRTDAALKKIERLMEKSTEIQTQITELQAIISNSESTEEEMMAAQAALASLRNKQEITAAKIEENAAKIEESRFEPTPIVIAEAPKAQGMSAFTKKKGVVFNDMELIRAIASGTVPMIVKAWDQKKIDDLLNMGVTLPGVVVSDRDVVRI